MKICHISNFLPSYHTNWGGAEQACYRIIELELKENQDVTIITTKPLKPVKEFKSFTVKILDNYIGLLPYYKALFPYDPIAYFSLKKTFKKIKPDIVHLHNFNKISFAAIDAAKKLGIPVVYSIYDYWSICPVESLINSKNENCKRFHGSWCKGCLKNRKFAFLQSFFVRFRKKYFNKYLNKIDKFIVLSNSSKEILKKYGIKDKKIKIIHLPLDIKTLKPTKTEKNSILYAAWLQHRKGLHILVKAFPSILKKIPEAKLYVIGSEGPEKDYKNEIVDFINKNNLNNKVFLLGKKSPEEVKNFLEKAEVVVVPEQWENMSPLIVIEAMAFAKPIVASKIGGIPEFVIHEKTGLLAKHNSPENFAQNILKILKNKKTAKKLGKNAQKKFKEIFNNKKIIENLLNTYQSLLKQRDSTHL